MSTKSTDLVKDITDGKLKLFSIEESVDNDFEKAVEIRREFFIRNSPLSDQNPLRQEFKDNCPCTDVGHIFDKTYKRCCENVIGYTMIPLGITPPILINGEYVCLPLSTAEGALVASISRGGKAATLSGLSSFFSSHLIPFSQYISNCDYIIGGITTVVTRVGMSRAPVLEFPSITEAAECLHFLETPTSFATIQDAFKKTSTHITLMKIHPIQQGHNLFIRFSADTGDAMGMNMVNKGVEAALNQIILKKFPQASVVSLSGNVCSDKKPTAINWIEGRGRKVIAECVITGKIINEYVISLLLFYIFAAEVSFIPLLTPFFIFPTPKTISDQLLQAPWVASMLMHPMQ